ncbi:pe38 like protein [Choristoneura fumiferana DEF multiple nucleopolyhedrovirus]|uniref:Pe38 like protein n=1 Tax=Choristoneura fumiferana defective polyhedrosis virus TaxID=74660 RepID=Q6VTJ3_NPVCD|nr:pe38 like protein [Choristoneura fumiferana DEF multiple nucleopolyhedrovirus]AAQ91681.1 pe38 like protein [Choristoneura fumiferana DEF multiple nucleopolyhedrovirus]
MSYRYTPYESQRNRQQLQKTLLESFRLNPVTAFGATCNICLETYMMQSNNVTEFLMPLNSSCTHMFCYKCIISMYSNVDTTRSNVNCPMCRQNITSWQTFFPNTSVSCKFTKKAAGNVPATQQFTDALKVLQSRCAPMPDDLESPNTEARQMLREQLNKLNQENKTLQETLNRNKTQHDIAWESSCAQISSLQKRISELEANPEVNSLNKNRELEEKNRELEEKNREVKNKNCELQNWNRELTNRNNELEENAQLTEAVNKINRIHDLENKNSILVLQSQLMEVESQNRELQDKQQAYELIVHEMKQQLEERGVSVDI